jgi:phospholipase/carboxylesterase
MTPTPSWKSIERNPADQAPARTVVLFHGYGASADDLAPLAEAIPTQAPWRWVFPEGPLAVPLGPHSTGRAWAHIDMEAIQRAMMRGEHRDLSGPAPRGFEEALDQGHAFLSTLGCPLSQVVLGGFSQGSMLATALALTSKEAPAGLVVLSGNLVDEARLRVRAPHRQGLPFFQSHGASDPVLGLPGARRLYDLLTEAGLRGEWQEFRGGHEIPWSVIHSVGAFLDRLPD